jgi:serine phosphatase RsbU (regulator of sigma subunit)
MRHVGPLTGLAVAASLTCSTLAVSWPSAAAGRQRPRATPAPASVPAAPVPSSPAADACCRAPAVHAPVVAGKRRRPASTTGAPGSSTASRAAPARASQPEPGAQPDRSADPQSARHRRASERAVRTREARSGEPAGTGSGTSGSAGQQQGEAGRGLDLAAARRPHEKGGKGKGKGKEPRHGHKPPQPAPPVEKPALVTLSAAAAPVAVSASAAPAPAAVSPPQIAGEASSPSTGSSPRAGVAGRVIAGGHAAAPALAASATVPASEPAQAQAAGGARRVSGAKPAPSVHAGESPLVTTVTKIINVVPPAIRLIIGGLIALALALAVSSRLTALRARRLARQRAQLLDDVGLLQAALLPALPGRLGPVGTSAAYRPASGPAAGGDFYDVFALGDGQLAVIVGDVSGHGRRALPHTALLRFTLRAYLEAGLSPRSALQTAAPVLERQLGDSLATVVLATYNPRERTLVYACAGHPPPLVIGTASITPITACSAPPIGAGAQTGTRQSTVSIPGGSLICFYTDGVVEARVRGELFGTPRLGELIADLGSDASAAALLDRVEGETEMRPDDMAACLLRVEGDEQRPVIQLEELELDRREAARGRAERFLLAGGLDPLEIETVLASARASVARHGRVLLALHRGDGSPRVALHPQYVTTLEPPTRPHTATAGGISI